MAQIDQQFSFQGVGIEAHIGNPQGSSGTNPKPPSEAPIIGPRVIVGTQLNTTVGSSKIVNPS